MNLKPTKIIKSLNRIPIVENNIETHMRNLAEKWKHSNKEVSDACRDAAEEIRVLNIKLNYLEQWSSSKFYPYTNETLGWGKGKDE